jgi:uncharacterized membrane protein
MKVALALGALLLICSVMSTKEHRRAARQRMKRWEPIAWALAAMGWAIMLWPWGRH